MGGSLLFVHGTGVKSTSRTQQRLRDGLARAVKLPPDGVIGVDWGVKDAPPRLPVEPILPPVPHVATKGLELGAQDEARTEDVRGLLLTDPLAELSLLATLERDDADRGIVVGEEPPDYHEHLEGQLKGLNVKPEPLKKAWTEAEITGEQLTVAAEEVAGSDQLEGAAVAAGDAHYMDLLHATARAVVASVLRSLVEELPPDDLPKLCTVAAARDELVTAVHAGLASAAPKGVFLRAAKAVVLPLATRAAVRRRADYMVGATDFLRDVAFYISRGESIRRRIQEELKRLPGDEPVVLMGHSLGGIAAVDLLSEPINERVDLLVTVGSQAPLLYLMDALQHLRPRASVKPFVPWLNIYDRNDLLSFLAGPAWPNIPKGIDDEEVRSGVPFPTSHSAYWSQDRLYKVLADHWPKP